MGMHHFCEIWKNATHRGSSLLVLLALADAMLEDEVAVISMEEIAAAARVSIRQAKRVVREIEADGIIETIVGGRGVGGRGWASEYTINWERLGATPISVKGDNLSLKGDTCDLKGDKSVTVKGDISARKGDILAGGKGDKSVVKGDTCDLKGDKSVRKGGEMSPPYSISNNNNNINIKKERGGDKSVAARAKAQWNQHFPNWPVRTMTPGRMKKLRARLSENEDFVTEWAEMGRKAAASSFIAENSFFSVDWILKNSENSEKLLAGNYDDKSGPAKDWRFS